LTCDFQTPNNVQLFIHFQFSANRVHGIYIKGRLFRFQFFPFFVPYPNTITVNGGAPGVEIIDIPFAHQSQELS